jgi:gas vesicle protein
MSRSRNGWSRVISAFAIGLGAGAALGVVLAPQSGEDTRERIRDAAQGSVDEAISRGKTVMRRAGKTLDDAKDFVHDVADTAEGAFREARKPTS